MQRCLFVETFCLRRRRFKFCQFWNSLQIQSSELVHNLHIHHHCKLMLPRAHVSSVKIFLVNPKPPHELNPKKQDLRWREMFPEDWKNLVRQLIPERLNITQVILHIKGWPATKMLLDGDLSNTSLQKNWNLNWNSAVTLLDCCCKFCWVASLPFSLFPHQHRHLYRTRLAKLFFPVGS